MKIFTNIYKYNLWGFGSGTGSLKFNNEPYIEYLNNFLKEKNDIHSILDIGCGDWQLNKHIDFTNKEYLGIDIVENVIKKNKILYSKKNIKFLCKNILEFDLPKADLYIVKDVIQHLSDDNIKILLNKLKKNNRFKYLLIINDVSNLNLNHFDIPDGMYKPIDITKSPFNLMAKQVLQYSEKIYTLVYFVLLLTCLLLVYIKGYKLYYFTLLLIIFYGLAIFPKKTVYLIKNE